MATVLILENERSALGIMRAVLRKAGRKVIAAQTAKTALRAAGRQHIDLLVADVILCGLELPRRLRERNPQIGYLFTYRPERLLENHLLDAARLGAGRVLFLPKPFIGGALSATCEGLLRSEGERAA